LPDNPEKNKANNVLDADDAAQICKALGHYCRIEIIKYLQNADKCICGEIVGIFPLAQSTVSQHLKILKQAGLIKGEVEGQKTCYCLDRDVFNKFKKTIAEM